MAGDYRDSFWGGSLEGFEVAAAASKRGWSAFKELAESLQGSRTAMEEHVKEGQRMSRDHMVKDAGINSPFFDAVFVAKEKQSAAAATCVDKLKALEERAKNETGKKDLEAFVKGAMTPQLANTVRLDQRKVQGKKGKEDKSERMEKLKMDTQRFEEAHMSEIQQLEGMERLSMKEMRDLLKGYIESQQTYHSECMEALSMLESTVDGLTDEEMLAKLTAQIGTGAEKPSELLAQGIISTSSAAAKGRSSTSLSSGTSVGKAFGTLRKKGDLLRKKTIDSLHNTSQSSVRSRGSTNSGRESARASVSSQSSTRSGAAATLAAAAGVTGWAATHSGDNSDAPHTAPDTQDTNADSGSYDDEPEDNKPKIMIKIRDDASEQPQASDAPIRLEMDPQQTRRRPQSPTMDRRRVRPTSSTSNDDFNPRSPASMPRVAPRSPLTNTLNNSSSFGTFRPGGQTVPGMQIAVTETCNAYFKGPTLGKVQVLGKMMVSFDKSIVEDLALDDKPFAFRVSNVSRLTDITPNTFLMANASAIANGAHVENDELVYELHAADLQKCFASEEAVEGVSVAGEQVRATVLSYSVTADSPLKLAPLRMCSTWRCGEDMTDVTVDYMHNSQATMKALTDILVTIDMKDMKATSCESEPRGRWHKGQLSWAIPNLAQGRGRLRGRFQVEEQTQTPTKVTVRFFGTGDTLSGVEVNSAPDRGSSLGFNRSIIRFMSGVYVSDYVTAPFSSVTPLSSGSLADAIPPRSSTATPETSSANISTASVPQTVFTPPPQRASESPPARSATPEAVPMIEEPKPEPQVAPTANPTVDSVPLISTESADAMPVPASNNPEYNHNIDIQLQSDELQLDAEPLPSARSAVNDDDSDDEPMVDKGKGPAIIVEPEHMEPQPSSGHERKESTASTTSQGLPTYDVLAQSGPAPQLDFDEFLKMTKPSPRAPRKN